MPLNRPTDPVSVISDESNSDGIWSILNLIERSPIDIEYISVDRGSSTECHSAVHFPSRYIARTVEYMSVRDHELVKMLLPGFKCHERIYTESASIRAEVIRPMARLMVVQPSRGSTEGVNNRFTTY